MRAARRLLQRSVFAGRAGRGLRRSGCAQSWIRRAAGLCDTCSFRINCAVNTLESGSDNGIWAGVWVEPTPARLRKAQRRRDEVIATEIIDTESVPYRVGVGTAPKPEKLS